MVTVPYMSGYIIVIEAAVSGQPYHNLRIWQRSIVWRSYIWMVLQLPFGGYYVKKVLSG